MPTARLFKSSTFKPSGPPTTPEQKERIRAAIEKHRPAMDAVIEAARQYAEEHRANIESIQSPELRKSAQR
jgi:hypothetical protein